MLINILVIFVVSFCVGLVALVYCVILPHETIGNKWYRFLKWITKGNKYLFKPLIDCSKCFAGQVALWGYFFTFNHISFVEHWHMFHVEHIERWGQNYTVPEHVLFVFTSIFFADRLTNYYDKN